MPERLALIPVVACSLAALTQRPFTLQRKCMYYAYMECKFGRVRACVYARDIYETLGSPFVRALSRKSNPRKDSFFLAVSSHAHHFIFLPLQFVPSPRRLINEPCCTYCSQVLRLGCSRRGLCVRAARKLSRVLARLCLSSGNTC